jgi:hypothetical protein
MNRVQSPFGSLLAPNRTNRFSSEPIVCGARAQIKTDKQVLILAGYTFTFTRLVSNETTKVCTVETLSKCKRAFSVLWFFILFFILF